MRVLLSAYACEPGKGSEPGAGWGWALAAARNHEVWVLTRANNREPIEAALAADQVDSLHFVYLDLPRWARFWKRGQRGVRLYYVLWQLLAAREAQRLHEEHRFDVVHHITFANLLLPALVCLAGPPAVVGPMGGGVRVPLRLYRALGARGAVAELLRVPLQALSYLNPLVWLTWSRAEVILVQNEETLRLLPRLFRGKVLVRPHSCVSQPLPQRTDDSGLPTVAYAGRLVSIKGVVLALRALRALPDWRLFVIGEGPDGARLGRVAQKLGLDGRVLFLPTLPQGELWKLLATARALVLPSLRDQSPLIAAEAQSIGLPVVALERGAPAVFGRLPGTHFELIPVGSVEECASGIAAALERVAAAPPFRPTDAFGLDGVARDLDAFYRLALNGSTEAAR